MNILGKAVLFVATCASLARAQTQPATDQAPDENHSAASAEAPKRHSVFDPILSDPRWPHFSAAYHVYNDDEQFDHLSATNFGYPFSFYRARAGEDGEIQFGPHAAVFALYDLDAESRDLVNADYFVALALSYRRNDFSMLVRGLHQSSHLGDEFILFNGPIERINYAYEAIDILASYDLPAGFRAYGGGQYRVNVDPNDIKRWKVQYGLEYRSDKTLLNGFLRPVAAVDVQHVQQTSWNADVSVRAGFELMNRHLPKNMMGFFEYYSGHQPDGQLFDREIEFFGVGLHVFF